MILVKIKGHPLSRFQVTEQWYKKWLHIQVITNPLDGFNYYIAVTQDKIDSGEIESIKTKILKNIENRIVKYSVNNENHINLESRMNLVKESIYTIPVSDTYIQNNLIEQRQKEGEKQTESK